MEGTYRIWGARALKVKHDVEHDVEHYARLAVFAKYLQYMFNPFLVIF